MNILKTIKNIAKLIKVDARTIPHGEESDIQVKVYVAGIKIFDKKIHLHD